MNSEGEQITALALSAGVGLLVGLERERNPTSKAGVRTFTLIALLGNLAALLAERTGSGWLLAACAIVVGGSLTTAYALDPKAAADDYGTTTIVAALVVFALGAASHFGHRILTVTAGIGMTALLYFKAELEGFSKRLTAKELRSALQFAVLSGVILPLLPNEPHGPYGVLNPFKIWLMVVLIEGVSLAGFFAWRLTDSRRGILLTGVLGGLVSSTATTFVQARKVKLGESPPVPAAFVILLANATMIVRVLTIVSIAAPSIAAAVSAALVPALPLSVPAFLVLWKATRREGRAGAQDYENPSHLRAALTFAVLYTLTLLASAWASSRFGAGGAYATAAVSGVADVDAITLSAADLARSGSVDARVAATMVALAVSTNLVVKTTIAGVAGGYALGRVAAAALAGPLAGLASGIALVRLLGL